MINNELKERAIQLFEGGNYKEAFLVFREIYNNTKNKKEKECIYQILKEAYYDLNYQEQENIYDKNIKILDEYPYVFIDKAKYTDNNRLFFPISDNEICIYEKEDDKFKEIIDIYSEYKMRYFFNTLEEPLFIENEFNEYNLRFLYDNVRDSIDFGEDNHIYLYYSSYKNFQVILKFISLDKLLKQRKFVFLIGEKNKKSIQLILKKNLELSIKRKEILLKYQN